MPSGVAGDQTGETVISKPVVKNGKQEAANVGRHDARTATQPSILSFDQDTDAQRTAPTAVAKVNSNATTKATTSADDQLPQAGEVNEGVLATIGAMMLSLFGLTEVWKRKRA